MIDEEKIVTPAKCNHDAMAKNSVFIMMMSSQISDDGRDCCSLLQTGSYFRMQNYIILNSNYRMKGKILYTV